MAPNNMRGFVAAPRARISTKSEDGQTNSQHGHRKRSLLPGVLFLLFSPGVLAATQRALFSGALAEHQA